jgi:hypothetical protein
MMRFFEADFGSLDQFDLRNRWTHPDWNVLPPDAVRSIRPLAHAAAKAIDGRFMKYCTRDGLIAAYFEQVLEFDCSDEDAARQWLAETVGEIGAPVLVTWDARTCVQVPWPVFWKYWNDFCYPGSDDVLVVPETEEWILNYMHWERFQWGRLLPNRGCP